jgi:general secretion pathway protein K
MMTTRVSGCAHSAMRSKRRSGASTVKCMRTGPRGLALIVVLWATAIITLLAAGFSFSLRSEARLSASAVQRAQGAAAANAGIAWLVHELLATEKDPLAADTTLKFHGFEVALQILPENAKVDLNAAPGNLLNSLIAQTIEEFKLDVAPAAQLTDAILDWRDADTNRRPYGAESADYFAAGRASGPRDGALLSVNELNQVLGMTPALFRALEPLLTVHAWSTKVAPLSASTRVLRAIPGLSAAQVEQFASVRDSLESTAQAIRMLNSGAKYLARTESAVYTLTARASAPSGVKAVRRAVVKISGSAARPVSILAWYEHASSDSDHASTSDADVSDNSERAQKAQAQ